MKRKCYFYNVGTTFDNKDKKLLKDCWNCNGLCCRSDLANGLWCEDYGIEFSKKEAIDLIRKYVESGVENTYGYIKEVEIDLNKSDWDQIYEDLMKHYNYENIKDAKINGFIPYEYVDIINDYSSYWEQPDLSYYKDNNQILKNKIIVKKENELNSETMDWINEKLYGIKKENNCNLEKGEL